MPNGQTVFAQLLSLIPHYAFRRIVSRYGGDRRIRAFSCWDQFVCMAFGQLTWRESLRDLELCLRSRPDQLYRLGLRGRVCRSTLAEANQQRDWRIYAEVAAFLIRRARQLYAQDRFVVELADATVYAFDATIIEISLGLFPWARFCPTSSAVKMNTLLDLRGSIPSFISITKATRHDVNGLDDFVIEPGAFYIMDRAYVHYARLYRLHQTGAFFVIRAKTDLCCRRLSARPVDKSTGLRCDQSVCLTSPPSFRHYPQTLRRIRLYDAQQERTLVFLTNNFALPAQTIADLYKSRWQIELFFKWIKGHLHLRRFLGNSVNAVKTQIWIAVSVYVLLAIVKKQLATPLSLHAIHQILSVNAFEKENLRQLLHQGNISLFAPLKPNQLSLEGF
jgi:hypothetical protein